MTAFKYYDGTSGTWKYLLQGPKGDTGPAGPAGSGSVSAATFSANGTVKQTVYNVLDYSATGNGTTDDTTAIQNAINAASTAGGGIVWFPKGTYLVTSLTLKSYVSLQGVNGSWNTGNGSIIKTTATTGDMLAFSATTGLFSVTIRDLRLEGPGSGTGNGIRIQCTGGSSKPQVNLIFRNLKVVNFGAAGIEVQCAITSTFDTVTVETCGTGFYLNGGTAFANPNTSIAMFSCYANGCTTYGYRILSTVYSSFHNLAADDCGTAYSITTCNALTFNACGCEWASPTTASPADGFKISGGSQIVLNAPYTFQNKHLSFWVTGSSSGIIFNAPQENTPLTATHSLQVDAGSQTSINGPSFTTSTLESGTVGYLDDGSGGMVVPGSYAYMAGTLEVVGAVTLDAPGNAVNNAVSTSATQTLTNKRIQKRVSTTTSSATPSVSTDSFDGLFLTAQAAAITSFTLSGTPTEGQDFFIRIKATGAFAITAPTNTQASGVASFPTTTVSGKTISIGLRYDSTAAKWIVLAADTTGY